MAGGRRGESQVVALATRHTRWSGRGRLLALLLPTLFVVVVPVSPSKQTAAAASATCGADVLGIAQEFNVFVQHDYSVGNTDVKGRAAAGGNVSINSYAVGVDLPPDSSRDDLIAGGSLTVGGGGAQAPHGSVTYGGSLTGTISTPAGELTQAPPPFDIAAQFSQLVSQSKTIGGLAANGTAGGPSYAFELIGTDAATNVFTIAASVLEGAQVIEIKVPIGSSTVINVTGGAYSSARFPTAAIKFWDGNHYVQIPDPASPDLESLRANLLWNFPDATSVQIGPNLAWEGTVLAPLATVTFPGSTQLNGTLIAATLVNSAGSARNHPYRGCLQITPPPPILQAADDSYAIQQPHTLEVGVPGVLANDTVPGGSSATTEVVAGPSHGTLRLAANGSFTYDPASGFSGSDSFTYHVRQGTSVSNTATVTIAVTKEKAKLVTFVARVCPTYPDVMANLARNDIQESLQDLGANSVYSSGQPIDPDVEAKQQPACTPLPDWQLTLGTGIQTRAVSGPWGSLSIVTNPFSTPIVTQDETDLLNDQGQPTGKQIAGATTITLTQQQADLAAQGSSLWVQGGTPTDPILDQAYPGQYGFAALRCAVDNLNGDNVEWIAYPSGATHVFCYAYYIQPPPTSGTIIVRKEVSSPANATETFPFEGNITFNADHRFELNVLNGAPASTEFFRAETRPGEAPWDFTEDVPPGWFLNGISCVSQSGESSTTTDVSSSRTTVTLAAGDTVTCTYSDTQTPPQGSLLITKTTLGGVGTFHYAVTPAGGGTAIPATATTTEAGVEVAASPDSISLAPGAYEIAETLPESKRGTWKLTSVECNGEMLPPTTPVSVTIASGTGLACRFVNRFVPHGTIVILKKTLGGVGTVGFAVYSEMEPSSVYFKQAKVDKEGVAVLARGDSTRALPLGSYEIHEFAVEGTDSKGWALTSVVCNGKIVGSSQGAITVQLTADKPTMRCVFTNTYTPPEPPNPIPPNPTPSPDPDPVPVTDLHVSKTADRNEVPVGGTVTYTIKVKNVGKSAAQNVVLTEQSPTTNAKVLSVKLSQGVCRFGNAPATCYLGTIEPDQTVTIVAELQATKVGPLPNNVTVNSGTQIVNPPTRGVKGVAVEQRRKPKPKPPHHTAPPLTG